MTNYRMTGSSDITPLEREILRHMSRLDENGMRKAMRRLGELAHSEEVA